MAKPTDLVKSKNILKFCYKDVFMVAFGGPKKFGGTFGPKGSSAGGGGTFGPKGSSDSVENNSGLVGFGVSGVRSSSKVVVVLVQVVIRPVIRHSAVAVEAQCPLFVGQILKQIKHPDL